MREEGHGSLLLGESLMDSFPLSPGGYFGYCYLDYCLLVLKERDLEISHWQLEGREVEIKKLLPPSAAVES